MSLTIMLRNESIPNTSYSIVDSSDDTFSYSPTSDNQYTNDTPTGFPCPLFLNESYICVNLTNNNTKIGGVTRSPPYEVWLSVILATMAGIVSITTVLGNVLVLLAFSLERSIRQPTNYFIASLAVSDLLIGFFSMDLYTLYLLLGYWPLGQIICDLWLSLDYTVCLASQYTVFFITVDRFCSVKIPAKYRNWRTEKKVLIMVAATWVIPICVFFPSIFGFQYFVGERTVPDNDCWAQFQDDALFNCILVIGYYWVTLVVMCGLYTGIYKVALDLQRKSEAKHKKMTSLVSMAGQTMSKIGIGMSRAQAAQKEKELEKKKRVENQKETTCLDPNNTVTTRQPSTTSFSSQKPPDNERSSSPAFPSDTDNDSTSPKPTSEKTGKGDKKVEQRKEKEVKKEKKKENDKSNNKKATGLKVPVSGSNSNTPPTDSGYGHSSEHPEMNDQAEVLCDPALLDADTRDNRAPSSLHLPSNPTEGDLMTLISTPDRIQGIQYIDQESMKSLHSSDNLKTLAEILPKPNGNTVRDGEISPVWKKRNSFPPSDIRDAIPPSPGDDKSLTFRNPSIMVQESTPAAVANHKPISMANIQVETIDNNFVSRTITKLAKNDELQPLNASGSKQFSTRGSKPKAHCKPIGGQLVYNIAKTVGSRKKVRSKKNKQKSKSENRARKALRVITFILGAFVLCWTPYHVIVLVKGFCSNGCVNDTLYNLSYWLCYLNSPINPFCYALANVQFKKTFIRILKRDFHRT